MALLGFSRCKGQTLSSHWPFILPAGPPPTGRVFIISVSSAGCTRPRFYTIVRLLPGLHVTFVEFGQEFERILKQSQPQSKKRQPSVAAPSGG
jgi:hypothetical protein